MTPQHRYILIEATPKTKAKLGKESNETKLPPNLSFDRTLTTSLSNESKTLSTIEKKLQCNEGRFGSPTEGDCSSFTMLYEPQIGSNEGSLLFGFKVQDFDASVKDSGLEGILFSAKMGNPTFVQAVTLAKYVLFFLSLICGIWFYRGLKSVPSNLRVVEQSLIMRQSVLLILFNDPFYAVIFYSPNHFQ